MMNLLETGNHFERVSTFVVACSLPLADGLAELFARLVNGRAGVTASIVERAKMCCNLRRLFLVDGSAKLRQCLMMIGDEQQFGHRCVHVTG